MELQSVPLQNRIARFQQLLLQHVLIVWLTKGFIRVVQDIIMEVPGDLLSKCL